MLCRILSLLGIMPQDWAKANELLQKAEECSTAEAYCKLSYVFWGPFVRAAHVHHRTLTVCTKEALVTKKYQ